MVRSKEGAEFEQLQGEREMEDKDEDLPKVSFWELLRLNKEDWHLLLIGTVMSALVGCTFPLVSIVFDEVFEVSW